MDESRKYRVEKEIRTPTARFPPGAIVTASDIAGPVPLDRWVRLGHLKRTPAREIAAPAKATEAATPASEPSRDGPAEIGEPPVTA